MILRVHSTVKITRKTYSILSRSWFVVFVSPLGYGVKTARATQFRQIVIKITHSNGFHSTNSIHILQSASRSALELRTPVTDLLKGLLRVIQNKTRSGLSANLFTGFPMTRRGAFGLLLAVADASGLPADGVPGAGVCGGRGVAGACILHESR